MTKNLNENGMLNNNLHSVCRLPILKNLPQELITNSSKK